ncbi:metallophosphoesterase [Thermoplasma sp.]|uniref:metallophosphoesterase family protein n=1 Tax=Thermoplasma sp. TaxID=1973142 RepID=UPI00127D3827|nr:metallophosphoesterase family protein [Thermoplasma sp.]KAA8923050.1 MAG: metallophosphoesterase family protein [Thermoplasma sp.]
MRLLILSDVHANIFPIKYVLEHEKFDKTVFCGDAVDYGPDPSETIDIIRENADVMVSGNHDYAVAYSVDCKCGEENHDLSVYTRENITMKRLGKNDISFLRSLKSREEIQIDGAKFQIMHASPRDELYGYMYPWSVPDHMKSALGAPLEPANYIVGHTHYQFSLRYAGNFILNPGSIGQPRDDRTPSYAVYDSENNSVELKRIDYDRSLLKERIRSVIRDETVILKLYKLFNL